MSQIFCEMLDYQYVVVNGPPKHLEYVCTSSEVAFHIQSIRQEHYETGIVPREQRTSLEIDLVLTWDPKRPTRFSVLVTRCQGNERLVL